MDVDRLRSRPRPCCSGSLCRHGRTRYPRPGGRNRAARIGRRFQYCRACERRPPRQRRPPTPRGALIVVAVGLLACVVAALLAAPTRARAKRPISNGCRRAPMPGLEGRSRSPAAGRDAADRGAIRATGTNVSGYSLFRVPVDAEDRRRRPDRRRPHPLLVKAPRGTESPRARAVCACSYPRSTEDGIFNQEVPETVLADFSSHGAELAVLEFEDLPATLHHRRGRQGRVAELQGRHRAHEILPRRRQAEAGPGTALLHDLENDGVPAAKISCTLTPAPAKRPWRPTAPCRSARRRSTKKPKKLKAEEREEAEESEDGEEG